MRSIAAPWPEKRIASWCPVMKAIAATDVSPGITDNALPPRFVTPGLTFTEDETCRSSLYCCSPRHPRYRRPAKRVSFACRSRAAMGHAAFRNRVIGPQYRTGFHARRSTLVQLSAARDRIAPAVRQAPRGMHPGPVMVPPRLAGGHRAAAEIRWIAGPVFPRSRSVHVITITLNIGAGMISAPLTAERFGAVGQLATFAQTLLRAIEGMAAS